jgi:hypothetical protein
LQVAEGMIKALIQEVGPRNFAIALGNSNCHGKAIKDAGYQWGLEADTDDSKLQAWHKAVDKLVKIGKWFEENS